MDDTDVVNRINELAIEEHDLERRHIGDGRLDDLEQERLRSIEIALSVPHPPTPDAAGREW